MKRRRRPEPTGTRHVAPPASPPPKPAGPEAGPRARALPRRLSARPAARRSSPPPSALASAAASSPSPPRPVTGPAPSRAGAFLPSNSGHRSDLRRNSGDLARAPPLPLSPTRLAAHASAPAAAAATPCLPVHALLAPAPTARAHRCRVRVPCALTLVQATHCLTSLATCARLCRPQPSSSPRSDARQRASPSLLLCCLAPPLCGCAAATPSRPGAASLPRRGRSPAAALLPATPAPRVASPYSEAARLRRSITACRSARAPQPPRSGRCLHVPTAEVPCPPSPCSLCAITSRRNRCLGRT
nr:nascent polypeptide-associated complex subunit alpha, muscle-specific form-like [Aegilops tauschii subsp. strangulata]